MKEMLHKIISLLLIVLFSPVICIGLLLYLPVDYFKYRSSHFFKDTKEKYALFAAVSPYVKFYDTVKANDLPVEHIRAVDAEGEKRFFYYKNYLILYDMVLELLLLQSDEDADEHTGIEYLIKNEIDEFNRMQGTLFCDKAIILMERSGIDKLDSVHIEDFDFVLVYDKKDLASVLKEFIMSVR